MAAAARVGLVHTCAIGTVQRLTLLMTAWPTHTYWPPGRSLRSAIYAFQKLKVVTFS